MRVYDQRYFDPAADFSDGGLGDWWNAVGQIGAAGVSLLPGLLGGGGSSAGGPARGLAAIQAAVQQALSSLQSLLAQAQQGNAANVLAEARRIEAALSNPQYVYQAQRGADAEALRNGKAQAAAIVAQIQSLASSVPASPTQTGGLPPVMSSGGSVGNPNASAPGVSGSAIDNSTLLIVGMGLVALFVLRS